MTARFYFDRWLKSLWFSPNEWVRVTRSNQIVVSRKYLPFWNFSIRGSVTCFMSLGEANSEEAHQFARRCGNKMTVDNVILTNINVYAAQTIDRYHLEKLFVHFNDDELIDFDNANASNIEKVTINEDVAFHIGWDLNVIRQIKQICNENAKQIFRNFDWYHILTYDMEITAKQVRLIYYPVFVIEYTYDSNLKYQCLVNGLTGQVNGLRQYSALKTTFVTLLFFYPFCITILLIAGPIINSNINIHFPLYVPFSVTTLFGLLFPSLIGLFFRYYPQFYQKLILVRKWDGYQSKSLKLKFYFRLNSRNNDDFSQQNKTHFRLQTHLDLYKILSVNPTANEKEIKRAYLIKAKACHPDIHPNRQDATEEFQILYHAYEILSNRNKRKQYDRYGYSKVK